MKFDIPEQPIGVKGYESYSNRKKYIRTYGFLYLSWNWLKPLIKYLEGKKCLEVMAGIGALAHVLQESGINILVTDDMSWHNSENYKNTWGKNTWVEIENLDAITAVRKYGKEIDVLIMSWPYMDEIAYETIKEMYNINPSTIILYFGESEGGCTADDNFFNSFEEIEDENFKEVVHQYYSAQWDGLHDYPMIGKI